MVWRGRVILQANRLEYVSPYPKELGLICFPSCSAALIYVACIFLNLRDRSDLAVRGD
jgi:hypothetical protein